jgi:hypothetical protein
MALDIQMPARFLETAFADDDLIAIAYRCLPSRAWTHRFVSAYAARQPRFLAWLRHLNAHRNDIFVSMNVFASKSAGRTEDNVAIIRHVYADFDSGGAEALAALRARTDLPPLSYVLHSSAGKFQAVWNVRDFDPTYAKRLLQYLAYSLGADPAVHDTNRVLRLAGFYNYKYSPAQFVRSEMATDLTAYPPDAFPTPPAAGELHTASTSRHQRSKQTLPGTTNVISRSERDWAHVRSALAAGTPWRAIWDDLIAERCDKPNPRYYAALTILNALKSVGRPNPPELVAELHASKVRTNESRGQRSAT